MRWFSDRVGSDGPVPEPRPVPALRLAYLHVDDGYRRPADDGGGRRGLPRPDRGDRRAQELAERRGDGRVRPRLRRSRRIHRQPHLADAGLATLPGTLAARRRGRQLLDHGRRDALPSGATPRPARRRSSTRSAPSTRSTGGRRFPARRTRTRRRWSTRTRRSGAERAAGDPRCRSTRPARRRRQPALHAIPRREPRSGGDRGGRGARRRPAARTIPTRRCPRRTTGSAASLARLGGSSPTTTTCRTHRPEGIVAVSGPGIAPGRTLHAFE